MTNLYKWKKRDQLTKKLFETIVANAIEEELLSLTKENLMINDKQTTDEMEGTRRAEIEDEMKTDLLIDCFDNLFTIGDFKSAKQILTNLNPQQLQPKTISGILMITSHARNELGEERIDFFNRSILALNEIWKLDPKIIESIIKRLK